MTARKWHGRLLPANRGRITLLTGVIHANELQVSPTGSGLALPPKPTRPDQLWTMDFASDAFMSGRKFRTLNRMDGFTRTALEIEPDTSQTPMEFAAAWKESFYIAGAGEVASNAGPFPRTPIPATLRGEQKPEEVSLSLD